jgi:phosphatidate cytidylyltransferase
MSAGARLRSKSELFQRVVSALVLAAVALGTALWGGWPFELVWAALTVAVVYEWERIVAPEQSPTLAISMAAILALIAIVFPNEGLSRTFFAVAGSGIAVVLMLTAVRARTEPGKAAWLVAGLAFGGMLFSCVLLLRGKSLDGFFAVLFLFIVVWLTDIGAYFAGRRFGGPKFAPRISPKKTWSGVFGGLAAGVVSGQLIILLASFFTAVTLKPMHFLVALMLGVATVYGDLFESFLKRRFGVKDAGSIIPGHGGFLDRLDGFTAAAIVAALIGASRGGFGFAGAGLIRW